MRPAPSTVGPVDDDSLLELLHEVAAAVRRSLGGLADWGLAGTRPGQYLSDLAADAAALEVLDRAGVGVLSEESGLHRADHPLLVVMDPVDGSTNASRRIPWFATSLCAVDEDGPRVALVVNQATGVWFEAIRGRGARGQGRRLSPSGVTRLDESLIAISGMPMRPLGWRQFRALGASALDLCAVAAGLADGFVDCSRDAHGPWDYLGGALICAEAGAAVADALGRDLVVREHLGRRTPVAAATPELLDALLTARAEAFYGRRD